MQSSSLWHNRDYLLLWSGQTASTLGSSISAIAFPLLILALTGSPALAGIAGALRGAPYVLFSLPAGALVDRWNLKHVMIFADTGRALALGSIPIAWWTGHLSLAQLYAATTIEGTLFVFYDIASFSALPRIVSGHRIAGAIAQNEGSYYAAGLTGPSMGGILYQIARGLPFLADTVSYLLSVLSLLILRADMTRERVTGSRHLGTEMMEGLRWAWRQPIIRSLSLLSAGDALVSSGSLLLVIVLARQEHASPATIGAVFSIAGVGGILGSLVGGQVQKLLSFGQTIIGVRWALVFLWPLYVIAPNPIALGGITAAIYFLNPINNVVGISYSLPLIPERLGGRVTAIFQLTPSAMASVGVALMGLSLQTVGPRSTAIIASSIVFVMAVLITLQSPIRSAPVAGSPPAET